MTDLLLQSGGKIKRLGYSSMKTLPWINCVALLVWYQKVLPMVKEESNRFIVYILKGGMLCSYWIFRTLKMHCILSKGSVSSYRITPPHWKMFNLLVILCICPHRIRWIRSLSGVTRLNPIKCLCMFQNFNGNTVLSSILYRTRMFMCT